MKFPPPDYDGSKRMPDSNRLEREIEEILGKIEQFPDAQARRKRTRGRVAQQITTAIAERQRAMARQLSRTSMSQIMLASFLLILGSLFFRAAAPVVMAWLLYAGMALFVTSFAFMVFSGRGSSTARQQQLWRGRPINTNPRGSLAQRVRGWWTTRSRR